jgi:hypothetical protein
MRAARVFSKGREERQVAYERTVKPSEIIFSDHARVPRIKEAQNSFYYQYIVYFP